MFSLLFRMSRYVPGASRLLRLIYGCDIPRAARISPSVRFAHNGMGVVIHRKAIIEEGCFIQHHVTVGMNREPDRVPHIHRNVFIGPYAMILGGVEIGEGAQIGAGSLVLHDVPPNTVFYNERITKTIQTNKKEEKG